jgi:hypothetical protein
MLLSQKRTSYRRGKITVAIRMGHSVAKSTWKGHVAAMIID